jgi:hypothetical protein
MEASLLRGGSVENKNSDTAGEGEGLCRCKIERVSAGKSFRGLGAHEDWEQYR